MNEDELENIILNIAEELKEPLKVYESAMTFEEAKKIFCALGHDDDLIVHEGNIIKVSIYVMLKQAQKMNQLSDRIGQLEKLSHEHFDPSKFGPA